MKVAAQKFERETPEKLVRRLAAQLRHHALWDALFIFLPPLLAVLYVAVVLDRAAWAGPTTVFLIVLMAVGLALGAILWRVRRMPASTRWAARLVDERAGAKDHFLTLATLEPEPAAAPLVARLRTDAAGYQKRVELKRDFPYRIKRSLYGSVAASIVAALAFQWLLTFVTSPRPIPAPQRLREVAEKMALRPALSELARGLKALMTKLEDPKVAPQEKSAEIQQTRKEIEEQQKKQEQKEDQDLLGQASSALEGLEQQSGSGQDQTKEQDKGGGSIESNLPQEGQGESKQSQGKGGDSKADSQSAQPSKNIEQGKKAQGAPQQDGQESSGQKTGEQKGDQPDANKPEKSQSKETSGKTEGGLAESGGKGKPSDDIPQGSPPAERFNKPGEGKQGIKGARYVTVQLPEEVAAEGKSVSGGTKPGRSGKAQPKLPVGNVPLPEHVPEAPAEKQPMPLEYRGMIR